jgi:DinB superfamily
MDFKASICSSLAASDFIVQNYLEDISPEELLMRPVPAANHIAWQLGHLIRSERRLAEAASPGTMPDLPKGFDERHSKEAAASDDPKKFLSKDEYLAIAKDVRKGTLNLLDNLSDDDLDKPVSGPAPPFVKRRGDALVTIGPHWMLHAGQWAILRRKLGRPVMF